MGFGGLTEHSMLGLQHGGREYVGDGEERGKGGWRIDVVAQQCLDPL